jgi:hypothetical protein
LASLAEFKPEIVFPDIGMPGHSASLGLLVRGRHFAQASLNPNGHQTSPHSDRR